MEINKFYLFSSMLSSSTLQVHAVDLSKKEDENGLFDQHKLILGICDNITFPVIFKQQYGEKIGDVLDTGWPGLFLISEKMKKLLEENLLTGWEVFPIKVLDKKNQVINGFHGLSIIGKCGAIDFSKAEVIEKKIIQQGPFSKYYKGYYVGLESWDHSDFFLPEKNFSTIISGRAAEVFRGNRLTNIHLENLAEIETPIFTLQ